MNKPLLVIAGIVVATGIVTGNLWRDLHRERTLNQDLQSQLAEARTAARVAAMAAPVPSPAQPVAASVPPPPAPATAAPTSGMTTMEQDAMAMQLRATTSSLLDVALLTATAGVSEQDLMKDPEYRKAEVLQLRMRLAMSNAGLAEAVGLSEREATRLFEAMAEDQLKRSTEMAAMRAAGAPSASVTASILQRSQTENPVRIALGEEKFAKYQDYTRSVRPALVQVAGIGSMLTSAGQPLNDAQARSLASAMLAEQQRQLQTPAIASRPPVPRGLVESLEESARREEESNNRILESAGAVLNAGQLDALRRRYDQEAAARRQSIESARRIETSRPLPALPPAGIPR